MSLILAGLVIAGTSGALVVGRWLARRAKAEEAGHESEEGGEEDAEARGGGDRRDQGGDERGGADAKESASKRKRPVPAGEKVRLEGFVCQLGDVVMRITGEEAWLAGGLVLSEEVPVAVLFVAPDAVHDRAIYVRARPREGLFWLEPLDPSAILVGGEPPSSVEHRGIRFDRARRLPLRPQRIGVGAPDVGDAAIVAEYVSAGAERLLVLKGNAGVVRVFRGIELEPASYEVIASGESTLD